MTDAWISMSDLERDFCCWTVVARAAAAADAAAVGRCRCPRRGRGGQTSRAMVATATSSSLFVLAFRLLAHDGVTAT